jgi:acyl carrier protein
MNLNSVNDLVLLFENEFKEIEKGVLQPSSNFRNIIKWDSMNSLVAIVAFELNYGISVKDSDVVAVNTVEELYVLLKSKLCEK